MRERILFAIPMRTFPVSSNALAHHYPGESVSEWALQFLDPVGYYRHHENTARHDPRHSRDVHLYPPQSRKACRPPEETLRTRQGSCRDFAVLMMEATRSLGVAARFVSGYIFVPNSSGLAGGGATHAWMQAYLPGAGWIDFDPTNSIVGNRNLIRVAVAWTPEQVLPLWGTYEGPPGAFLGMDVTVNVTEAEG